MFLLCIWVPRTSAPLLQGGMGPNLPHLSGGFCPYFYALLGFTFDLFRAASTLSEDSSENLWLLSEVNVTLVHTAL